MLKKLSIAVLLALGASSGQAAEFLLTDSQQGLDVGDWKISSDKLGIKSPVPLASPPPFVLPVFDSFHEKGAHCPFQLCRPQI